MRGFATLELDSTQQLQQEVWDLRLQPLMMSGDEDFVSDAALTIQINALRATISNTACANGGVKKPPHGIKSFEKWYSESCGYCGKQARLLAAEAAFGSLKHRAQSELKRAKSRWKDKFNTQHYLKCVNPALVPVVTGKQVGRGRAETRLQLISTLLRTRNRLRGVAGFDKYVLAIECALNYLGV